MAKDYAYRTSPSKRPTKQSNWQPRTSSGKPPIKKQPPSHKGGLIIVIILLILIAASGILYFKHHPLKLPLHQTALTIPKKAPSDTTATDTTQPQSVQFDFYTTLPAASPNVMPPVQSSTAASINNPKTSIPAPNITPSTTASSYILQLASLTTMDDAVALQDKLQAAGFNGVRIARIEHGGNVWYRVQIGPYSDKQSAVAMQQKLQQQNFDSVVQPVS